MSVTIELRASDLSLLARIDDFTQLDVVLRFNGEGTWVLRLPATGTIARMVQFSQGIVVKRNNVVLMSGIILRSFREWAAGVDSLTLSGIDDTGRLGDRLALPVPSGPPYTASEHHVQATTGELALRAYVDANAGPGATVGRRIPGLVLGTNLGLGTATIIRARFQNLMLILQQAAAMGGGLGFKVVQVGATLEFQVFLPVDKTATAIFSPGLGNLRAYSYVRAAGTATYVYAGGGGEGTARVFAEAYDPTPLLTYGRIEKFMDRRDIPTLSELQPVAQAEAYDNSEQRELRLSPLDTAGLQFGTHYNLGDRVTVVVDGIPIQDVVREVRLSLTAEGEALEPVVGPADASEQPAASSGLYGTIRVMATRINQLERR